MTSWWTGEQAIHNSQWSPCCAWRLAAFPCSLGLLRAASPTGRALRAPPPLPSSIRNGRSASCAKRTSGPPLLIGLTTACFRHRRRPSCAPLQFPLKSYGFPGAETARKRFLLWKMGFSVAAYCESMHPSIQHGRPTALAGSLAALPASLGLLRPASATGGGLRAPPPYTPPGTIETRKGFASLWFFDRLINHIVMQIAQTLNVCNFCG